MSNYYRKQYVRFLRLTKRGFVVYSSVYIISSQDEQHVTESDVTFYRRPKSLTPRRAAKRGYFPFKEQVGVSGMLTPHSPVLQVERGERG